jgi:hypothetical protein
MLAALTLVPAVQAVLPIPCSPSEDPRGHPFRPAITRLAASWCRAAASCSQAAVALAAAPASHASM